MSYSTWQDGAGTCTSQCTSNTIDGEDGCVVKKEETENQIEDPGILDGAGGNMADSSDLSSDEDSEKCPICLNSFHQQPVATPESCDHYFCVDCILEWAKSANSCPVDRQTFCSILLRKCHGGTVLKRVVVEKVSQTGPVEALLPDLDQTSCEVCGGRDREDCLLLCDNCDAGYHMDCLVPALATVPVEEWFCPQCSAHHPSGASQLSEDHLPTASHFRSTRAIARTQHSERVRANVNQRRITQAGTAAQLARGYMTQSTWLDDAINAVVAGLNTAVYVRDLTPRAKSRRRRKRRTDAVNTRKTKSSSSLSLKKKRKTKSKRRKRKVSQFKLRRQLTKTDSRSRIKQSLGSKAKQSSVYQHGKDSLGIMRSEIGAPSLSVYGDPFILDPFDNRDEESSTPTTSSAVNAKRRTLSRSALRSHQPMSRAFLSLSRPPVPDLLGSILSGQSALLMDSSDVVIHPDGSLQPVKTVSAAALPDSCPSAPSRSEPEPASVRKSPAATHTHSPFRSISSRAEKDGCDALHRSRLRHPAAERKAHKPAALPRKPCKPSWLDVSVLPRIPKIKREENSAANPNPERASTSSSSPHKSHMKPARSTHTHVSTGSRRSGSDTGDITLLNTALKLPAEDVNTHSLVFPTDIKTDKRVQESCESGSKPRGATGPIKADQQTANSTERDRPDRDGWESSEASVAASTSGPRERRVASGSLQSEKYTGPQKREGDPTSTKVLPSSCQNTTELVDSRPKSCRETELQDSHQKERFLNKLRVQQRVIEMVKLAMKPFYQRGDVTKDEYKDISRKAVQKVCHSGSVEVDPVKVTNLVRAYVQKVKSSQRQRP